MNKELQRFARNELKAGLAVLPLTHHAIFKRMYSKNNLDADIATWWIRWTRINWIGL